MARQREDDKAKEAYAEALRKIEQARQTRAITLDLARLGLTSLPPEIGALTALQTLFLDSNQLSSLPSEIAALTALHTLFLSNNQLSSLPPEISALTALQTLNLCGNQLTSLPPEISALTALQSLYLSSNQLTSLPPEISALTALQRLELIGNQLTSLPPEISALTALQELNLHNNQLTSLPPEIRQLTNLEQLFLHDNPALNLPPEVLGPTRRHVVITKAKPARPADILDYYFTHRQAAESSGTEPLMEAKVLVLGEASVGKTCLIAALSETKKRSEVPEGGTSGIVRKLWPVRVQAGTIATDPDPAAPGAETLRLNCWDFGGQEIYHSAHTLFLTERAIYLIVISKRENERQNNVDYWLKMAASFGGPDAVTYVVVNMTDEKVGHAPDEEALRRRYPHLRGFLYTSCDDLTGIPEARQIVVEEALRLKGVRLPVARSWLAIKKKLETMPEHTLSMAEWDRLCGSTVTAEEARRELLHLCDRLGTVRYFPTGKNDPPELCERAILNPEWVTLGIYALFDDKALKKRGGLLDRAQMAAALKQRGYPPEHERIIEEVMRRFYLLYDSADHGDEHRMLIPLMLPELEPAFDWPKEGTLEFVYQYAVMPAGLLPAFMARTHRHMSKTPGPWRHGCVLELRGCRVRVIGDRQTARVSISVSGPEALRREALDGVRHTFDDLHGAMKDPQVEEWIPVPGHPKAPMLKYGYMRSLEWKGIQEHEAECEAFGQTIPVNVREALDGVRGQERRKQDNEQRPERGTNINVYAETVNMSQDNRKVEAGRDASGVNLGDSSAQAVAIVAKPRSRGRTQSTPTRNNPWPSGSFYVFSFVAVIGGMRLGFGQLNQWWVPAVGVIGIVALAVIGALQMKNDDRLKDKPFLTLMFRSLANLSLLRRFVPDRDAPVDKPPQGPAAG